MADQHQGPAHQAAPGPAVQPVQPNDPVWREHRLEEILEFYRPDRSPPVMPDLEAALLHQLVTASSPSAKTPPEEWMRIKQFLDAFREL